ncbi:MAG: AAA family ATPase [Candidatus Limnocylindrales bacterium]
MSRHAIAVALPSGERAAVVAYLTEAGFDALPVEGRAALESLLASRRDIGVAILDGESDLDAALDCYACLHDAGRSIPALMVVAPTAFDVSALPDASAEADELFTRPYSVEALRWRVEAMLIRSQTVDDGSGPIIESDLIDAANWARRAQVIAIFNPKGGVGKTTVATNLAAALRVGRNQRVLLVDADTVTGHVATSLGLEQVRTAVASWRDETAGSASESLVELAAEHENGMRVVSLANSPLHTEVLEPKRVADAIAAARRGFDYLIVDMHPSYSPLNQAIFERADRILVPVTPDVPAIRAAIQLRDVATELGFHDRLALVVNRANSGVSVADMERTVGLPALALIRSGGMFFVRAANEGRTVFERFPHEKVSQDFGLLAERLVNPASDSDLTTTPKASIRSLFGRPKEAVRA